MGAAALGRRQLSPISSEGRYRWELPLAWSPSIAGYGQ
jgi:hypothetical protein